MAYLRNAWYVAAWDDELAVGKLLSRKLLDEAVILFRDSHGAAKALHGICPHRLAPLARGRVVGDAIQCGYHGLTFDQDGLCTHNPFGAVPKNVRIRSYPMAERYGCIWIWMGDVEKADESQIPDFGFQDPETHFVGREYLHVDAGYLLEVDNILDVSHIEFLHPTTLGSGQVANGRYEAKQDGDIVWSNRDVSGEIMTDSLSQIFGLPVGTTADRWIHVRWTAPANLVIYAGAVPTGRPYSEGYEVPGAHFFTPETETTTHYWYSIGIPKSVPDGEALAQHGIRFLQLPFEDEDKPMLEDQQASIGERDLMNMKLFWLPGDAGSGRARKVLREKIAAEQADTASNAPPEPVAVA